MESYSEMKERHGNQVNEFEGLFWAFSNDQFAKGMETIGLTEKDTKQICSIGMGGFMRKDRKESFESLFDRQGQERKTRLKAEKELVKALVYELANHEFCITGDPQDAVRAVGAVNLDPKILKKAIKISYDQCQY